MEADQSVRRDELMRTGKPRRLSQRFLLAVLAASIFQLAGCDADGDGIDDTTGEPVGATGAAEPESASRPSSCGPGGWTLLCGDPEPGDALDSASGIDAPDNGCPVGVIVEVGEQGRITGTRDGSPVELDADCIERTRRWAAEVDEAFEAGPSPTTWTVRDARIEDGRCYLGLDGPDGRFSRRVTTAQDCRDHPVGSRYHTGGAS